MTRTDWKVTLICAAICLLAILPTLIGRILEALK